MNAQNNNTEIIQWVHCCRILKPPARGDVNAPVLDVMVCNATETRPEVKF
jgi:hypothetical protein